MSFLQKKLTRVWQSLFDANSSVYLPNYLPEMVERNQVITDYDLGIPIPAVDNLLLNNIAVGNATAHVTYAKLSDLKNIRLPDNHKEVELQGVDAKIYLEISKVQLSGNWGVIQNVNRWTTIYIGIIPIPWRENAMRYFSGSFTGTPSASISISFKVSLDSNPDNPPKVTTENISVVIPYFGIQFTGNDTDSNLIAGIAGIVQALNRGLTENTINNLKAVIMDQIDLKGYIDRNLNNGVAQIWSVPV